MAECVLPGESEGPRAAVLVKVSDYSPFPLQACVYETHSPGQGLGKPGAQETLICLGQGL